MKKLIFFIIALLWVSISQAQRSIVIKGKIVNCPNPQNAFIEKQGFNTERLEAEKVRTDFSISKDGRFTVRIPNADEFYVRYNIFLGKEKTTLELIEGDSLYMTLNAKKFDESIKYKGRGAGRNSYLRDVYLEFWDQNAPTRININDPKHIVNSLDTLTIRKLALLKKYFIAKEIDSSYYQFEKAMIINEKANIALSASNRFLNRNAFSDNISRQLDLIIRTASFNDDNFLQRNEFRELITGLPAYSAANNSFSNGVDLNQEIKFASTHYTNLMQLYFNKQNIGKYVQRAHGISEKRALLNFFDKQFDALVLKKEIQQQRQSLRNSRIRNSNIYQAFIMLIFWFVVLVLTVFGILKLIKYYNNKRLKINLALWLKIVFYSVVSFFSLLFVNQQYDVFVGIATLILFFGTFLVHTYLLIPNYAMKGNIQRYLMMTIVLVIICVGGCYLIGQILSLDSILIVANLLFLLLLFSWLSYYINQLASGKSTIKELIKNGHLNIEIAINMVIILLVNTFFILQVDRSGILNQVILFYTIIVLLYFHTFITYPRTFRKDRIVHFIGINVFILLGAAVCMILLDASQSYYSLKNIGVSPKLPELISTRNIRPDLLIVFSLLLIPSFVYFYIKRQLASMESTGFQLYRKKEAELAQLRSQVNPHFLFNTLNTLYAFALKEGSDKTAECIAKLANLMRFMLDDMEKESIPLTREISYIKDYIKLQSIRSAVEHDITINVEMEEEKSYSIAPMLLIPFVENAFKHGMNPGKVSQLKIDIRAKGHQIQFVIDNSIDDNFQAYYKEKGFGIGIENVKSRLMHVYPDRHSISIAKTTTNFIVILTIDLD